MTTPDHDDHAILRSMTRTPSELRIAEVALLFTTLAFYAHRFPEADDACYSVCQRMTSHLTDEMWEHLMRILDLAKSDKANAEVESMLATLRKDSSQ